MEKKEIRFKLSADKHDEARAYADLFDMTLSSFASLALMEKVSRLKSKRVGIEPPDNYDPDYFDPPDDL